MRHQTPTSSPVRSHAPRRRLARSANLFARLAALLACAWLLMPLASANAGDPYLSLDAPSVQEGDSGTTTLTFTARLIDPNGRPMTSDKTITAHYEVLSEGGDTATAGTDYTATSGTLTFTPGEQIKTIAVSVTGDTDVEGDETLTVKWTGWKNVWLVRYTHTGTISNDDIIDSYLGLDSPSVQEGDSGTTTLTFTARLIDPNGRAVASDKTITAQYQVLSEGGDTATAGTDYTATSGTLTFTPGEQIKTIAVHVVGDTDVEGDETLTVKWTDWKNVWLVKYTHTGTITNDDIIDSYLSLDSPSVQEGDSGTTTLTFTARLTDPNGRAVASEKTITAQYQVLSEGGDTATAGTDYTATSGTLTFAPGEQIKTIAVHVVGDTDVEGDETLTVRWTDWQNVWLVSYTHTGTITNDDPVPAVNPSSVSEAAGATTVTVTATFSNSTTYAADKMVWVTVGDSADSATSGTDYTVTWGSLSNGVGVTIAAGASSGTATFTLTPTSDTLAEGNETISVDGSETIGPGGTATGFTVNGTDVTLTDPVPAVNLTVNPSSVSEAAGATTVTVTATFSNSSTYGEAKTVSVTAGDSADSATSGTDYTVDWGHAASGPGVDVTIAAGTTSGTATFTLTPTNDTWVEGDETISVDGTATGLTVNGASVTLTDDDNAVPAAGLHNDVATVTVSNARAVEGDTMTFTLTLDKTAPGNFTVTPVYQTDIATEDLDYTANTTAIDFAGNAGEQHTFTVATLADDLVEADETFGVSLDIDGPPGIRGRSGSGTIDSTDVVTVVAMVPDADLPTTLHEAGGPRVMTARVWANGFTFSTDMTFTVQVGDGSGTAREGVDYETVPDFEVIIPAGATSATRDFTVTPVDDRIVEGDETIGLSGTLPGYEVAPHTLTLLDDDTPAFSLAVAPARVRESDGPTPVTVTVETGGVSFPADVSVAVEVSDGTAIAGEDYAPVAAFAVLIPTGESSGAGTFTLIPTADGVEEDDETIIVAGLANGYELAPEAVVLADATVAPNRLDAVNRELLPHVARALLSSNVAALTECGVSGASPGSNLVNLLGTHGDAFANGETSLQQVLGGADFRVPLKASQEEASSRLRFNSLWGCGDYRSLSDRSDDALTWDGNLFSLHLGIDVQPLTNLTTGLALSRSQATFDYQDPTAAGQHQTAMTSVSPYVRWSLSQGMSLWAMAGLGWGSVDVDDALAAGSSDAGLTLAAIGLDNALLTRLHGNNETSLRLKAEGSIGRLAVDGSDTMSALTVEVQRLRLALEGSRTWNLRSGGAWTTALEVGLRHDGGDGATGSGVKVGGGVSYRSVRSGVTIAASGRTLVAHGADYGEWGVGGLIRYDPGTQGVGLSASVQPALGQTAGGAAQLWEQALADPSLSDPSSLGDAARVEAEIAYGLRTLRGRGLLKPYSAVSMAGEGSRNYRVGSRLELGDTLRVGVEVGRREASGAEADHGVMLRLELGSGGGVGVGGGLHDAGSVDGRLGRYSSRAWDAGRD